MPSVPQRRHLERMEDTSVSILLSELHGVAAPPRRLAGRQGRARPPVILNAFVAEDKFRRKYTIWALANFLYRALLRPIFEGVLQSQPNGSMGVGRWETIESAPDDGTAVLL